MARAAPSPRSDPAARFDALYTACYRDILGYALRRTSQPQEAADVVADTFLTAWHRIGDVPPGDQARPWLFGVARRVLANHRRGARRHGDLAARLGAELARHPVVEADAATGELAEIGRVFRSLHDGDQELLRLVAWEGLDSAGLAVALGCSANAARIRLHRARRRFAKALRAAGVAADGLPAARTASSVTT
ncbi:RNA polymerase sigma factor [Allonocardiopsis opalescens]|uniref:RNA polymerase ECF family sigma subunit n=1 Tax=Allonocardiopsis opalescens TaxID=1144618 RepID=A0A2T0QDY5_9ACTN|nr:sigma-70 family RNA polymerase sigma factor [Allonocardiopsis opalescens]PRY02118.1 RNA polymerase ECF family sigma subunit [Allonocardiopsis opalescens]